MTRACDVVVIGGGAAGLFAAARAGARGRRVLVVEHTATIGAKILISGGGRCNFTNLDVRADCFLGDNPQFARSALARFTQFDFIHLVERAGISHHEKAKGQLFCTAQGGAKLIRDMLVSMCVQASVEIVTRCAVHSVRSTGTRFELVTSQGNVTAASVIVATGGLSIPKLGATGFAYDLAAQFGLPVVSTCPALVPLVFGATDQEWIAPLAGVSLNVVAQCGKKRFEDGLVFTHRGLSGPAILQISSYWQKGQPISLNLAPTGNLEADILATKATRPRMALSTQLSHHLPARLAQCLVERNGADRPLTDFRDGDLRTFAAALQAQVLHPIGDEGYVKAEVTRGGVDTRALSQKTMVAKAVPGLYFVGEAVDITGWLGGYNFQWAWSSGAAAGDVA